MIEILEEKYLQGGPNMIALRYVSKELTKDVLILFQKITSTIRLKFILAYHRDKDYFILSKYMSHKGISGNRFVTKINIELSDIDNIFLKGEIVSSEFSPSDKRIFMMLSGAFITINWPGPKFERLR